MCWSKVAIHDTAVLCYCSVCHTAMCIMSFNIHHSSTFPERRNSRKKGKTYAQSLLPVRIIIYSICCPRSFPFITRSYFLFLNRNPRPSVRSTLVNPFFCDPNYVLIARQYRTQPSISHINVLRWISVGRSVGWSVASAISKAGNSKMIILTRKPYLLT